MLLGLPTELRIMVWEYMTLSPLTQEREQWLGAFFACKQMQHEIRTYARISDYQEHLRQKAHFHNKNTRLKFSPVPSQWAYVQEVYVSFDIRQLKHCIGGQIDNLREALFELYLGHLKIFITGKLEQDSSSGFFGLKGIVRCISPIPNAPNPTAPLDANVNCKKLTFTMDHLAIKEGARHKETRLDIVTSESKIPCTLLIVENEDGEQVERTYSSPTRFRPQ